MELRAPPRPHHFTMHTSTQIAPPGVSCAALCSLMDNMKSLISVQRYLSPLASSVDGPTVYCRLNLNADHIVSKQWRDMLARAPRAQTDWSCYSNSCVVVDAAAAGLDNPDAGVPATVDGGSPKVSWVDGGVKGGPIGGARGALSDSAACKIRAGPSPMALCPVTGPPTAGAGNAVDDKPVTRAIGSRDGSRAASVGRSGVKVTVECTAAVASWGWMRGEGEGAGAGTGPVRMLRRPRFLTAVVPRNSNRPEIVLDMRPSTLNFVTAVTMPFAIASFGPLPRRRAHVHAEQWCLTLSCIVEL